MGAAEELEKNDDPKEWYVAHSGQAVGPYRFSKIESAVQDGSLPASTPIIKEGMSEWTTFERHKGKSSEVQWFIHDGESQKGPISSYQLTDRIAKGAIPLATVVWSEGMENWEKLADVFPEEAKKAQAELQAKATAAYQNKSLAGFRIKSSVENNTSSEDNAKILEAAGSLDGTSPEASMGLDPTQAQPVQSNQPQNAWAQMAQPVSATSRQAKSPKERIAPEMPLHNGMLQFGGAMDSPSYWKNIFGLNAIWQVAAWLIPVAEVGGGFGGIVFWIQLAAFTAISMSIKSRRMRDIRGTEDNHWPIMAVVLILCGLPWVWMFFVCLLLGGKGLLLFGISTVARIWIGVARGKISNF